MIEKEITKIEVPSGIKFISDFKGFKWHRGVYGKQTTGCGCSTQILRSDDIGDTILFVPRISLLLNKAEQEKCQPLYGEISTKEFTDYLENHHGRKVIICTWDSAARLKKLVGGTWNGGWKLFIDEFQLLVRDSAFKSYSTVSFIEAVRDAEHQTWISATPCWEVIQKMPHLKDLKWYELDWKDKETVEIQNIYCKQPINALGQIIKMYQQGDYPTLTDDEGNVIKQSKTMNAFFSSVNGILSLVKAYGLTPQDTRIICAGTDENIEALRKMGFTVGTIEKKGQKRRKFTLATSTAFQGMDFYGEDTTSYVIADCRHPHLSIIASELCQICGRERLAENPFRKTVVFIHNDWGNKEDIDMTIEEKLKAIREKYEMSREEMELFNKEDISEALRQHLIRLLKSEKKSAGDALSYTFWDEASGRFSMNELSQLSDEYQIRVQYSTYRNGTYVLKNIEEQSTLTVNDRGSWAVAEHVKNIVVKTTFAEKMEQYCKYRQQTLEENFMAPWFAAQLERQNESLRVYYDELGAERIKALGYKEKSLQAEMKAKKVDCYVRAAIDKIIKKTGREHTAQEWKAIMGKVYEELKIDKKPVRTNLEKLYGYKMKQHHRSDNFGNRYYTYEIIL